MSGIMEYENSLAQDGQLNDHGKRSAPVFLAPFRRDTETAAHVNMGLAANVVIECFCAIGSWTC